MKKLFLLFIILNLYLFISAQDFYVLGDPEIVHYSKDSLNGKTKNMYTFGGFVKLNVIYDFVGLSNITALNIPEIPVGTQFKNPYISFDTYQTRLWYGSTHQTKIGKVLINIVGDFWGSGSRTNFRLRQAVISIRRWDFGHAWSTFVDLDAWPIMNDWDGPPTGAWTRQAMIRYNQPIADHSVLSMAVESPLVDYNLSYDIDSTLLVSNQNIPDMHLRYKFTQKKYSLQLAGVYRNIKYMVKADSTIKHQNGWGLMASGFFTFDRGDHMYVQLLAGQGISRYLVGFSGQNYDAISIGGRELDLLPITGGFIGYDHYWDRAKKYSSTVVLGSTVVSNDIFESFGNPLEGFWALANFYWKPIPKLQFSLEYTYGYKKDHLNQEGNASRIAFMAFYKF